MFGADIDYFPLQLTLAPPGVSLTSVIYPTSASVQPSSFGSWGVSSFQTKCGLQLTGYSGLVRFYLSLQRTTDDGDFRAFDLRMIPVNAAVGRLPSPLYHGPRIAETTSTILEFQVH